MSDVSVVMSVYDEPEHVQKTIESVLKQEAIDFEFIIVSDGASDAVIDVVNSFSGDERIRFIKQQNQGLTVALINGCNSARSPFIARIDAGDTMHKSRLSIQRDALLSNSRLGIVASWVRVETLEGYFLYNVKQYSEELEKSLRAISSDDLRSVFHASVMFSRSVYRQVGGYRQQFYFSQDCDLWARMIEKSGISVVEQVLTTGVFSARGISGQHATSQQTLSGLIAQANKLRQEGQSDAPILEKAHKVRPGLVTKNVTNDFDGLYFIAKILTDNKSKHAMSYWRQVLKLHPLSIKSWFFFLISCTYRGHT